MKAEGCSSSYHVREYQEYKEYTFMILTSPWRAWRHYLFSTLIDPLKGRVCDTTAIRRANRYCVCMCVVCTWKADQEGIQSASIVTWKHQWKGVRGALKDLLKILADCRWDAKRVTLFLCTWGEYYVPYRFLLISNKSRKEGGSGSSRAIKFLNAPAPLPPTVWALKPPS